MRQLPANLTTTSRSGIVLPPTADCGAEKNDLRPAEGYTPRRTGTMSVDRLLTAALRAYQEPHNPPEINRVFATTTTLLSNLNNPLNLSLLTSHLLTARSIWEAPDGMRTCLRILSIFNTAARHVKQNDRDNAKLAWGQKPVGSGVRPEAWARAVAKGADERSSRWKHMLVLTGVLVGMEGGGDEERTLSSGLRSTLEQAVVTAANLALDDPEHTGEFGANAVVLALTYAFPLLSDWHKSTLRCDALLPATVQAMVGADGFRYGAFLRTISAGNVAGNDTFYRSSPHSFAEVQHVMSLPLVQNMGPLSMVAAFAVQHAQRSDVILQVQESLLAFSADLLETWRLCPFSTIDILEEAAIFSPEMLQGPWGLLWQGLKKIMYTVVGIMQPIVGRCLLDPGLRNHVVAPGVAAKALNTLRNLYFISSRNGWDAFQVYTFTYLTSIDIIAQHPDACAAFLKDTLPAPRQANSPPMTPLDEALTLFYLNVAEHLPLSLPTPAAESLIMAPATSQLFMSNAPTPPIAMQTSLTRPLFESSHSAILSVMSCPQHAELTISAIPFYIDTLLHSFPSRISARQFRLAFKTVMQIVSPPFPISATHPHLSETLLEMLHFRSGTAGTIPLPAEPRLTSESPLSSSAADDDEQQQQQPAVSEQATLVLALIDALPFLPLPLLEGWLTRTAEVMNAITDGSMHELARRRFWDVLVSGEMDVERAAIGVAWWGTQGGREMVLLESPAPGMGHDGRGEGGEFMMSGALGGARGVPGSSRL